MGFVDGNIVWVKMGGLWWPGEVYGDKRLPNGLLKQTKPFAFVKFFQHNNFLPVYQHTDLNMYQCARKMEFIKRGMNLVRTGIYKKVDIFPADVAIAELRTSGDPDIIYLEEFGYTSGKPALGNADATTSSESSPVSSASSSPSHRSVHTSPSSKSSPVWSALPYLNHRSARKAYSTPKNEKVKAAVSNAIMTPYSESSPVSYASPSTSHRRISKKGPMKCFNISLELQEDQEDSDEDSDEDTPCVTPCLKCNVCGFTTTMLSILRCHKLVHDSTSDPTTKEGYVPIWISSPEYDRNDPWVTPPYRSPVYDEVQTSHSSSPSVSPILYSPRSESPSPNHFYTNQLKRIASIRKSIMNDWCDDEDNTDDENPTTLPTILPTILPTTLPTILPTILPNILPTTLPTILPTILPAIAPSIAAAPPEPNPVQDEPSVVSAPPSITPKYRNIPKKDRREIIQDRFLPVVPVAFASSTSVQRSEESKSDPPNVSQNQNNLSHPPTTSVVAKSIPLDPKQMTPTDGSEVAFVDWCETNKPLKKRQSIAAAMMHALNTQDASKEFETRIEGQFMYPLRRGRSRNVDIQHFEQQDAVPSTSAAFIQFEPRNILPCVDREVLKITGQSAQSPVPSKNSLKSQNECTFESAAGGESEIPHETRIDEQFALVRSCMSPLRRGRSQNVDILHFEQQDAVPSTSAAFIQFEPRNIVPCVDREVLEITGQSAPSPVPSQNSLKSQKECTFETAAGGESEIRSDPVEQTSEVLEINKRSVLSPVPPPPILRSQNGSTIEADSEEEREPQPDPVDQTSEVHEITKRSVSSPVSQQRTRRSLKGCTTELAAEEEREPQPDPVYQTSYVLEFSERSVPSPVPPPRTLRSQKGCTIEAAAEEERKPQQAAAEEEREHQPDPVDQTSDMHEITKRSFPSPVSQQRTRRSQKGCTIVPATKEEREPQPDPVNQTTDVLEITERSVPLLVPPQRTLRSQKGCTIETVAEEEREPQPDPVDQTTEVHEINKLSVPSPVLQQRTRRSQKGCTIEMAAEEEREPQPDPVDQTTEILEITERSVPSPVLPQRTLRSQNGCTIETVEEEEREPQPCPVDQTTEVLQITERSVPSPVLPQRTLRSQKGCTTETVEEEESEPQSYPVDQTTKVLQITERSVPSSVLPQRTLRSQRVCTIETAADEERAPQPDPVALTSEMLEITERSVPSPVPQPRTLRSQKVCTIASAAEEERGPCVADHSTDQNQINDDSSSASITEESTIRDSAVSVIVKKRVQFRDDADRTPIPRLKLRRISSKLQYQIIKQTTTKRNITTPVEGTLKTTDKSSTVASGSHKSTKAQRMDHSAKRRGRSQKLQHSVKNSANLIGSPETTTAEVSIEESSGIQEASAETKIIASNAASDTLEINKTNDDANCSLGEPGKTVQTDLAEKSQNFMAEYIKYVTNNFSNLADTSVEEAPVVKRRGRSRKSETNSNELHNSYSATKVNVILEHTPRSNRSKPTVEDTLPANADSQQVKPTVEEAPQSIKKQIQSYLHDFRNTNKKSTASKQKRVTRTPKIKPSHKKYSSRNEPDSAQETQIDYVCETTLEKSMVSNDETTMSKKTLRSTKTAAIEVPLTISSENKTTETPSNKRKLRNQRTEAVFNSPPITTDSSTENPVSESSLALPDQHVSTLIEVPTPLYGPPQDSIILPDTRSRSVREASMEDSRIASETLLLLSRAIMLPRRRGRSEKDTSMMENNDPQPVQVVYYTSEAVQAPETVDAVHPVSTRQFRNGRVVRSGDTDFPTTHSVNTVSEAVEEPSIATRHTLFSIEPTPMEHDNSDATPIAPIEEGAISKTAIGSPHPRRGRTRKEINTGTCNDSPNSSDGLTQSNTHRRGRSQKLCPMTTSRSEAVDTTESIPLMVSDLIEPEKTIADQSNVTQRRRGRSKTDTQPNFTPTYKSNASEVEEPEHELYLEVSITREEDGTNNIDTYQLPIESSDDAPAYESLQQVDDVNDDEQIISDKPSDGLVDPNLEDINKATASLPIVLPNLPEVLQQLKQSSKVVLDKLSEDVIRLSTNPPAMPVKDHSKLNSMNLQKKVLQDRNEQKDNNHKPALINTVEREVQLQSKSTDSNKLTISEPIPDASEICNIVMPLESVIVTPPLKSPTTKRPRNNELRLLIDSLSPIDDGSLSSQRKTRSRSVYFESPTNVCPMSNKRKQRRRVNSILFNSVSDGPIKSICMDRKAKRSSGTQRTQRTATTSSDKSHPIIATNEDVTVDDQSENSETVSDITDKTIVGLRSQFETHSRKYSVIVEQGVTELEVTKIEPNVLNELVSSEETPISEMSIDSEHQNPSPTSEFTVIFSGQPRTHPHIAMPMAFDESDVRDMNSDDSTDVQIDEMDTVISTRPLGEEQSQDSIYMDIEVKEEFIASPPYQNIGESSPVKELIASPAECENIWTEPETEFKPEMFSQLTTTTTNEAITHEEIPEVSPISQKTSSKRSRKDKTPMKRGPVIRHPMLDVTIYASEVQHTAIKACTAGESVAPTHLESDSVLTENSRSIESVSDSNRLNGQAFTESESTIVVPEIIETLPQIVTSVPVSSSIVADREKNELTQHTAKQPIRFDTSIQSSDSTPKTSPTKSDSSIVAVPEQIELRQNTAKQPIRFDTSIQSSNSTPKTSPTKSDSSIFAVPEKNKLGQNSATHPIRFDTSIQSSDSTPKTSPTKSDSSNVAVPEQNELRPNTAKQPIRFDTSIQSSNSTPKTSPTKSDSSIFAVPEKNKLGQNSATHPIRFDTSIQSSDSTPKTSPTKSDSSIVAVPEQNELRQNTAKQPIRFDTSIQSSDSTPKTSPTKSDSSIVAVPEQNELRQNTAKQPIRFDTSIQSSNSTPKTSPTKSDSSIVAVPEPNEINQNTAKQPIRFDTSIQSSNSTPKTSPTKSDTPKDLDCFDFTEDDETEAPTVLKRNNRSSLPTVNFPPEPKHQSSSVSYLGQSLALNEAKTETIHSEPQKTLPLSQPEKISPSKDDERPLHPKERNKRIFKSRIRSETTDNTDRYTTMDLAQHTRTTAISSESKSNKPGVITKEPLQVVLQKALKNDEKRLLKIKTREADQKFIDDFDLNQKDLAITDEEIKMAEPLITFPMLTSVGIDSPTADLMSETTPSAVMKSAINLVLPSSNNSRKRTFDEARLSVETGVQMQPSTSRFCPPSISSNVTAPMKHIGKTITINNPNVKYVVSRRSNDSPSVIQNFDRRMSQNSVIVNTADENRQEMNQPSMQHSTTYCAYNPINIQSTPMDLKSLHNQPTKVTAKLPETITSHRQMSHNTENHFASTSRIYGSSTSHENFPTTSNVHGLSSSYVTENNFLTTSRTLAPNRIVENEFSSKKHGPSPNLVMENDFATASRTHAPSTRREAENNCKATSISYGSSTSRTFGSSNSRVNFNNVATTSNTYGPSNCQVTANHVPNTSISHGISTSRVTDNNFESSYKTYPPTSSQDADNNFDYTNQFPDPSTNRFVNPALELTIKNLHLEQSTLTSFPSPISMDIKHIDFRNSSPVRLSSDLLTRRMSIALDSPGLDHLTNVDSFITTGGAIVKRITSNSHTHDPPAEPKSNDCQHIQIIHSDASTTDAPGSNSADDKPISDNFYLPSATSIIQRTVGSRMSIDQPKTVIIHPIYNMQQSSDHVVAGPCHVNNLNLATITPTNNSSMNTTSGQIRCRRNTMRPLTHTMPMPPPPPLKLIDRIPTHTASTESMFITPAQPPAPSPSTSRKRKQTIPDQPIEQPSTSTGLPQNSAVASHNTKITPDYALRSNFTNNNFVYPQMETPPQPNGTARKISATRRMSIMPGTINPRSNQARNRSVSQPNVPSHVPATKTSTSAPKRNQARNKTVSRPKLAPATNTTTRTTRCNQPNKQTAAPLNIPTQPAPQRRNTRTMSIVSSPPPTYIIPSISRNANLEGGLYEQIDNQALYLNEYNQLVPVRNGEMTAIIREVIQPMHEMRIANVLLQNGQPLIDMFGRTVQEVQVETNEIVETGPNNTPYRQHIEIDQQAIFNTTDDQPEFGNTEGQRLDIQSTIPEIFSDISLTDEVINSLMSSQPNLNTSDDSSNSPDILAAALAGTDEVYPQHGFVNEVVLQPTNDIDEGLIYQMQDLSANTIETNVIQPNISALEHPATTGDCSTPNIEQLGQENILQSPAVIGATHPIVPSSLEQPINVANPAISSPSSNSNPMTIYVGSTSNSVVASFGMASPTQISSPIASADNQMNFQMFASPNAHTNNASDEEIYEREVVVQNAYMHLESNGHHYFVDVDDTHTIEMDSEIVPVTPESVTCAARRSPFGQNDFSCDSSDSSHDIPIQPTYVQRSSPANGLVEFEAMRPDPDDVRYYDDEIPHEAQEFIVQQDYIDIENDNVLVDSGLHFMDNAEVLDDFPANMYNVASLDEEVLADNYAQ